MKHQPSRSARKILRWFVNAEFVEEIEGDLEELFFERLSTHGLLIAQLYYFLDVLQAIRPYHPKRKSTKVGHEILNGIFIKFALRNLARRKAYSAINIFGLGIGVASFLLIVEYVAFERSFDSFHKNADRIYRIAFDWGETDRNGKNSSVYASSVPAMGPAIVREIGEVDAFTRFIPVLNVKSSCVFTYYQNEKLKYTGNADHGFYADSAFLKIFSFPMLKGNENPLSKPRSVVLTRSFAVRIFGNIPYNKIVGSSIVVDAGEKEEHVVAGILEDLPTNSHIQFDYLISYATINSGRLEGNLGWSQFYTYVLSDQPLTNERLAPKFKMLLKNLYGKESHISIFLQPLKEIYLTSDLREEAGVTGSAQQLTFLTIIAYTILFMAWFNYINMFLARSMERVNEIGVKKMLGSTRIHLIVQFFTESMLINVASFVVAVILLLLAQQSFENWLGKDLSSIFFNRIPFVTLVFAGILLGSLMAALYPSVRLSSYQPIQVLGRKFHSSKQGIVVNQGLIYFQFIVSFTIVACTLIISRQINYMKEADLGIHLSGCVAVRSPGDVDSTYQHRLKLFKERLLTYPFIKNVSSSSSIPGKPITTSGGVQRVIGPELDGNNVFFLEVDANFLNTYDIRLIAGKNFSEESSGIPTIVLNEAALQTLKFESPQEALNHRIHWQRKEYEVIGVFANYNHLFLKETFEPIILNYNPSPPGFLTFKTEEGYYERALAAAEKEMQTLFPTAPFEYDFLESAYDRQYHSILQFEFLATYFSFLAIVIACLGLFALSYFSAQKRVREMAVRKVFGAGVLDVLLLLSGTYLKISLVSSLFGSLLAFYVMRDWLQNFAFAVHLGLSDFFIPFIVITAIVALTVGYNCCKTTFVNPSHSLKNN